MRAGLTVIALLLEIAVSPPSQTTAAPAADQVSCNFKPGPTPAPLWLAYPPNSNDPVVDPNVGKIVVRGIDPSKSDGPTIVVGFPSPLPVGAPAITTSPFPSPFATSPPGYGSMPYVTITLPKLQPSQLVIVVGKQRVWANDPPSCSHLYVRRIGAFGTRANYRTLYRVLDVGTRAAPKLTAAQLRWLIQIVQNGYWDARLRHLWFSATASEHPLTVIDDGGYDFRKVSAWEPVYHVVGEECSVHFARNETMDPFIIGPPESSCTDDPLFAGRSGGGPRTSTSKALLSRMRALLAKAPSRR